MIPERIMIIANMIEDDLGIDKPRAIKLAYKIVDALNSEGYRVQKHDTIE